MKYKTQINKHRAKVHNKFNRIHVCFIQLKVGFVKVRSPLNWCRSYNHNVTAFSCASLGPGKLHFIAHRCDPEKLHFITHHCDTRTLSYRNEICCKTAIPVERSSNGNFISIPASALQQLKKDEMFVWQFNFIFIMTNYTTDDGMDGPIWIIASLACLVVDMHIYGWAQYER